MISSQMKTDITRRLGPIVKYTVTGGFYWDKKSNKFAVTTTYTYWMWYSSYYVGQGLQMIFALRLFFGLATSDTIPDVSEISTDDHESILLFFVSLMYWALVTGILSVGSIIIIHREDMVETLNQLFQFDDKLIPRIVKGRRSYLGISSHDVLIACICYGPLIFPLIFGISFFHQSDPVHDIFENLLEIRIATDSWIAWNIVGFYAYGVLAFTGSCISLVLVCLLGEFTISDWLRITMPTEFVASFMSLSGAQVSTERLGVISETDIIWVYRCLQIISGLTNSWIANVRVAYHGFVVQVMAIVASFTLIRYSGSLLENGTAMGISLIVILLVALGLSMFIFYTECRLADGIDTEWQMYKNRLLHSARRNGLIYKAAKSFRSIAVMTTSPFCNVNKSTFLEWSNVVIDNLVSLLVSF